MASVAAQKPVLPANPGAPSKPAGDGKPVADVKADLQIIMRELAGVADYVSHIKREIGALRANEISRSRLPVAHDELGSVVNATASATNTIMRAAEDILGYECDDFETYRNEVQAKVLEIFEACSFQDITGQRINKVLDHIGQVEKRMARFVSAVNARDIDLQPEAEDARKAARQQELLLNGPSREGEGVSQNDIDALFD